MNHEPYTVGNAVDCTGEAAEGNTRSPQPAIGNMVDHMGQSAFGNAESL